MSKPNYWTTSSIICQRFLNVFSNCYKKEIGSFYLKVTYLIRNFTFAVEHGLRETFTKSNTIILAQLQHPTTRCHLPSYDICLCQDCRDTLKESVKRCLRAQVRTEECIVEHLR
ncbi:unnamed protein product [Ceratitis capitata]|uniref:(Mediterranean fruit fly) hypothetical protein n=1 Tax=Ceratitis capitata TaxID=7213 RepID=A0A811UU27_CERCA|nr:unnamed protein product [Ceratitis capitata]